MQPTGRGLSAGMSGDDVGRLHDVLTALGFALADAERRARTYGQTTALAVRQFQQYSGLPATGAVDADTQRSLAAALARSRSTRASTEDAAATQPLRPAARDQGNEATVMMRFPPAPFPANAAAPAGSTAPRPAPSAADAPPSTVSTSATARVDAEVTGTVYAELGHPATGLDLRLYHIGFGCADTVLAEAVTDAQGRYRFGYEQSGPTNVQVRVRDAAGAERPLSATRFSAGASERLNLVAPAAVAPRASEYARLTAALRELVGNGRLADARESGQCRDITMLSRNTGWDARLVALAAAAERLSQQTGVDAQALYALLRVGLPGDATALAGLGPDAVSGALRRAADAGVSDVPVDRARSVVEGLSGYAARYRRENVSAPGALSTVGELLARSGLDDAEQRAFEAVADRYRTEPEQLWTTVARAGIPSTKIESLRLQGKLAHLTLNNAPLAAHLQEFVGSIDRLPSALLDRDLHRAESWQDTIRAAAGNGALADLIPPAYSGDTVDDRLVGYAADLARKVRLALPTHVVARRLETGELRMAGAPGQLVPVLRKAADELGFRFTATPAGPFLRDHHDALFAGVPAETVAALGESICTLQRVYQITPDDDAMRVLLDAGLHSAFEVTAIDHDDFVARHAATLGKERAGLVYRKAQQVSSVTYTAFAAAGQVAATPPMLSTSAPPEAASESKDKILKHFPTMEQLFGSLDFCACDHCRSVLSPAAYLVDLLRFLDPDPSIWKSADPTPYQVLTDRRPDLPRLQLTCENTNTVLPYIDVVNEILEYAVAHGTLDTNAVHDVGEARTVDLLTEPANLLGAAYDVLKSARYPLCLPYDLWLLTVRRFLDALDAPLATILEALRPSDELDPAPTNPPDPDRYGWRAVFIERLGLTPAEYSLCTDAVTHQEWHTLYGYPNETAALAELSAAGTLARRLRVSYRELVDLVLTDTVNPDIEALAELRTLGLDLNDVRRYFAAPADPIAFTAAERTAFEQKLTDLTAAHGGLVDVAAWLQATWTAQGFDRILVLADATPTCGFEGTELRYLNGDPADPAAYLRLNLLVRLWRRLGWRLGELDAALRVFLPSALRPLNLGNVGTAFATALPRLAHLQALTERVKTGRNARVALLALWSPMDPALYATLFLTPGVHGADPVFDHPIGRYLSHFDPIAVAWKPNTYDPNLPEDVVAGNVGLIDHVAAVRAAVGVTAEEISLILADAGQSVATAPLTLDAVSLVHRYRLLAKGLGLSIVDLVTLRRLAGVDPFTPLPAGAVTTIGDDVPHVKTLRFVEIATAVREAGVPVAELDYLLRHRYDPAGAYRPRDDALLALVHQLAAAIGSVDAAHATPADPLALTDELIAQKAPLALSTEAAAGLLGLWTGTVLTHAAAPAGTPLDPAGFADEPTITVDYNDVEQVQHLTYRGVLGTAERTRLVTKYPAPIVATLLDQVGQQLHGFVDAHLSEPLGWVPADFDLLFVPDPNQPDGWQRDRRARLAATLLPYLRRRLTRQLVVGTLAGDRAADPTLVEALVTEGLLLDAADKPLLDALTAVAAPGITLGYFASVDGSGPPLDTVTATDLSTADRPLGTASARANGYLYVPATGAYRFFLTLAAGTRAELRLSNLADPLVLGENTTLAPVQHSAVVRLAAGTPYLLTVDIGGLATDRDVTVQVQGENLSRGSLSRLTCHPGAGVERFRAAYTVLAKTLRLAAALGLGEATLRHLVTHADDFDGLDLSALPVAPVDDGTVLFGHYLRLAAYARLRADLGATGDELVDIFRYARRTYSAGFDPTSAKKEVFADACARFATLTRRTPEDVADAATTLNYAADANPTTGVVSVPGLTQEAGLRRLWTVLSLAQVLGVTPAALRLWATAAPTEATAKDLRGTLKARYEPEAWRRVARPVSDALRRQRRDALVDYLLHREDKERVEELYELYLIDPGTEPVVQTSRLRLAISSVQLFIQRCLLNLEPQVRPGAINAAQWEWMKRYRIWEANRKIFLWPENWMEPEFRDDKTHLFRALEGTLLQGEVTADLAEDAFFAYLTGLEALARLEIMSTWLEEDPDDPQHTTLHVLGRTHHKPNAYFYRQYLSGEWTPWQPVTTPIDSDHVVLAIWRNRPCLFWLTVVERSETPKNTSLSAPAQGETVTVATPTPKKILDISLNWSEYVQGQWSPGASSGFGQPVTMTVEPTFDRSTIFIHAAAEKTDETDEIVIVLGDGGDRYGAAQAGNAVNLISVIQVTVDLFGGLRGLTGFGGFGGDLLGGWGAGTLGGSQPEAAASESPGSPPFLIMYLMSNPAFRLVSRNSPAEVTYYADPIPPPFTWQTVRATQYQSTGPLHVWYTRQIEYNKTDKPVETKTDVDVLRKGGAFSLVVPPTPVGTPDAPEIGSLIRPFFYQSDRHTFYVEPSLTESTFTDWPYWIVTAPAHSGLVEEPPLWTQVAVQASGPKPQPPEEISAEALFAVVPVANAGDVVTAAGRAVQFDAAFIH